MATVGHDFAPYRRVAGRATACRATTCEVLPRSSPAQAFITTDLDDNQITAFHPGRDEHSHLNQRGRRRRHRASASSRPTAATACSQHAAQFAAAGIPFIFDPGQGMPMFGGEELKRLHRAGELGRRQRLRVEPAAERTGWTAADVAQRVEALVVTRGARRLDDLHAGGAASRFPARQRAQVVDPTGCGDAYRAGLIHGLLRGLDWETTGRIASLMGAIKIESRGTQNHRFTPAEFAASVTRANSALTLNARKSTS